jgi:preprotein translocase subunit SecD
MSITPCFPVLFASDGQYNPGGKAPFTGNDLDGSQVSIGTDTTGRPSVLFEMKGSAIQSFGSFTQQNIGNYLLLLDHLQLHLMKNK